MKLTNEMIEQAKKANTPQELFKLAQSNGMPISAEEAEKFFEQLNPTAGEISEDELENVSGGGCGESDLQGNHVRLPGGVCPHCGAMNPTGYYKSVLRSHTSPGYYMENLDCCGNTMSLHSSDARKLVTIN